MIVVKEIETKELFLVNYLIYTEIAILQSGKSLEDGRDYCQFDGLLLTEDNLKKFYNLEDSNDPDKDVEMIYHRYCIVKGKKLFEAWGV